MVLLVQEMKDLQRKFHLKLLSEQKGLDNEIWINMTRQKTGNSMES